MYFIFFFKSKLKFFFFLKKRTATIENGKERSVRERVRARGSAVMKVKGQLRMGHGAGWVVARFIFSNYNSANSILSLTFIFLLLVPVSYTPVFFFCLRTLIKQHFEFQSLSLWPKNLNLKITSLNLGMHYIFFLYYMDKQYHVLKNYLYIF